MHTSRILFTACSLLAAGLWAEGQDHKPAVKHVPIARISPASGQQMYRSYCASCHGTDAKGTGPVAASLNVKPADLTRLSRKRGGTYPALAVQAVIRGDSSALSHGSKQMPVWGHLFWSASQGDQPEVQLRLANLTDYIETLQEKDK